MFIHPLKSAAPVALDELHFDELGASGDRRWLLVDSQWNALTQRDTSLLALVRATLTQHHDMLTLHADGQEALHVQMSSTHPLVHVRVWDDVMTARDSGDVAAAWCSRVVGVDCRLVYIDAEARRAVAAKYGGAVDVAGRIVSFTDGSPILILSTSSIAELNRRLAANSHEHVGVDRFRPNILVDGVAPHEEDEWNHIAIGSMRFGVGSTCPRCVMTTIDQKRGERAGNEPLHTLADYRRAGSKVMFGVNATHETVGSIRIGDAVHMLSMKSNQ